MGTFIEGLNLDIQCEVKARQPRTMIAAISFARLHEEKISKKNRRQPRTMTAVISFAHLHEEKISKENRRNRSDNKQMISKPPVPSILSRNPNTRRLTREELKERLAMGLC